MKLSDYVVDFLNSNGAACVFEVCGGSITHLLDSIYKYDKKGISAVSMHHEQAAAFAAEGYARANGNIGVAMATSGPGATNLITGIASCFFDSIPCLFITGQVNTYEFKFNKPVRQMGFQETDIVNIVKPIVKEAVLVTDAKKIRYYLERAVYIAKSGRQGPVLLDMPMNIQRADINPASLESFYKPSTKKTLGSVDSKKIKQVVKLLGVSSRPVVLVGGGVTLSKAEGQLYKFISATKIPVVASLRGLDAFPGDNNSFVGMIGTYGNRYANLTLANADLVIALGTRLDTRQTGTQPKTFARAAKIVHVDIDANELRNKIKPHICVKSDINVFLSGLNKHTAGYNADKIKPWLSAVQRYKRLYPSYSMPQGDAITPNFFMHKLSEFIPENSIICADIGQNQMWAAQSLKIKKGQRFFTQGGMAAMGSALSMGIGASFVDKKKTVVVITGDGGFQLNSQELQTVYHHKLPIKIILLNNNCYGMVRQFQKQYFNSKFQSTVIGYSCPDFQDLICAYKIPSTKIKSAADISGALKKLFEDSGCMFLEVVIKQDIAVLPKLSVNKPIEEQDPALTSSELKSNMFIDTLPK